MRPSDGRLSLWPVGVVLFIALVIVVSTQATMKLNEKAPTDFLSLRATEKPTPTTAGAYWKIAVNVIQWKYSRTSELPQQAPSDFNLAPSADRTISTEDRGMRAAYWAKLREEWMRPENWHTTYQFSLDWVVRDLDSLQRGVRYLFSQT